MSSPLQTGLVAGDEILAQFTVGVSSFVGQFLSSVTSLVGKSTEQKSAEYALSAGTNEIEKGMDINSLAFRAGYISQSDALRNYDALWNALEYLAQETGKYSPAQASRTLTDRDYGGQFANIWRGVFRDDRIIGATQDMLSGFQGFVLPEYRWDVNAELFKYGIDANTFALPVRLPSPTQISEPVPITTDIARGIIPPVAGALSSIPAPVKILGGALIAWRILRWL